MSAPLSICRDYSTSSPMATAKCSIPVLFLTWPIFSSIIGRAFFCASRSKFATLCPPLTASCNDDAVLSCLITVRVGLAILCITKHRVGSKGGLTVLGGEPAYKHRYLYYNDSLTKEGGTGGSSSSSKFITPRGIKPKGHLYTIYSFHCIHCGHSLDFERKSCTSCKNLSSPYAIS